MQQYNHKKASASQELFTLSEHEHYCMMHEHYTLSLKEQHRHPHRPLDAQSPLSSRCAFQAFLNLRNGKK